MPVGAGGVLVWEPVAGDCGVVVDWVGFADDAGEADDAGAADDAADALDGGVAIVSGLDVELLAVAWF